MRVQQLSALIVDPDVESLFSIASFLLMRRAKVLTARDSKTGKSLATIEKLDLLLVSHRLADCSGVNFVERVFESRNNGKLPVVFISSCQIPDVARKQHSFGDAYCVRKDSAKDLLTDIIRLAVPNKRLLLTQPRSQVVHEAHLSNADHNAKSKNVRESAKIPLPLVDKGQAPEILPLNVAVPSLTLPP